MDTRISSIIEHLIVIQSSKGYVCRSDLERASDINHIHRFYSGFIDFCTSNNIKTKQSKRLSTEEQRSQLIIIIKQLNKTLGRTPQVREVKAELMKTGRRTVGLNFSELLIEAGCTVSRTTTITSNECVARLEVYRDEYGYLPYAKDLKTAIGIAPNIRLITEEGGYISFLAKHGLINFECYNSGIITPIRTIGADGVMYDSKCEAMLANFLLRTHIPYISHFGIGTYNHKTNQLTVDFMIKYDTPIALEIDGLGPIRSEKSKVNMTEKKTRCLERCWKWLVVPRDKVRYLCSKQNMEYWDRLVSSAVIL
jgi:hypothetical protein